LKNRFQDEHFRAAVISRDEDVIKTFQTLIEHMPPVKNDNWHLFLSVISNSRSTIWYKAGISVGEGMIRSWMRTMAKNAGVEGDITNKSGRVTSITRMIAARVPPEVIAKISGHRNLNTLSRYDRVALLKARAAHVLLRQPYENGKLLDFETVYAREMDEYNRNQLGEDIIRPGYDVLEDGTELDDPTDMNGFIDDCVGEEEISAGNVSHAEEMDNNSTVEGPCADFEIRGPTVVSLDSRRFESPSVPMPPNTGYGIGSVTHVRVPMRPPSGFTKMTTAQASRGTSSCVHPNDYPSGGGNLRLGNNPRQPFTQMTNSRGIYPGRTMPINNDTNFRPLPVSSQHTFQQGSSPRPLAVDHSLPLPYRYNYPRPSPFQPPVPAPRSPIRAPIPVTSSHPQPQGNLGLVASVAESSYSDEIFHDCAIIDWASFEREDILQKVYPPNLSLVTNYSPDPSKIDSSFKGDLASNIGHDGSDSTARDEVPARVTTVVVSKLGEDARAVASPVSSSDPHHS